jgi:predicted XRE-type DNA-binding protein
MKATMTEKVTEFELMQAMWDCSCYVRDLPTREETSAIKAVTCEILGRWIQQQDLPVEEGFKLLERITSHGPVALAAKNALNTKYNLKRDESSND